MPGINGISGSATPSSHDRKRRDAPVGVGPINTAVRWAQPGLSSRWKSIIVMRPEKPGEIPRNHRRSAGFLFAHTLVENRRLTSHQRFPMTPWGSAQARVGTGVL